MEQKTPAQQRRSWVFLSTKNHLRNKAWRASGPSEVASWASVVVPAELLVLPLLVFLSETFLLSNLQGSVKKISSLYRVASLSHLVVLLHYLLGLLPVKLDKGDLDKGGHHCLLVLLWQSEVCCE